MIFWDFRFVGNFVCSLKLPFVVSFMPIAKASTVTSNFTANPSWTPHYAGHICRENLLDSDERYSSDV